MNIAITQRIHLISNISETRDCLDQKLNLFVKKAGHLPVPLPNLILNNYDDNLIFYNNIDSWMKNLNIKGIVLSGGEDLTDQPNRDFLELNLINYAEKNNIPVLGICRGMQIIAKKFGVNLKKVSNHVAVEHKIVGDINGVVNSFHNFSIEKCPNEFISIAVCEKDNEIEAISHRKLSIEGWMWHPERQKKFQKKDIEHFNKLFF